MPTSSGQSAVVVVERDHGDSEILDCGSSRARAEMLADGIGKLVEGQRQFAEEFGLPYERVFRADFEQFKGRRADDVVRAWLRADAGDTGDLDVLLRDLVDHQLALVSAVESVAAEAEPARSSALERILPASLLRRWRPPVDSSLLSRVVAAYARSREAAASARDTGGTVS